MKRFLRFCLLIAFAVLPVAALAGPLPPAPPIPPSLAGLLPPAPPVPPTPPSPPSAVKAPELDLTTVSSGMAVFVGAGWMLLRRRRNRRG
jgi:hypothetical protein